MSTINSLKKQNKYAWSQFYTVQTERYFDMINNENRVIRHIQKPSEISPHLLRVLKEMYAESRKKTECSICLDVMTAENLKVLGCGHFLHTDCYEPIALPRKCPLCRKRI